MRITSQHKAGFTLVEIMIVVAIIGLLAAIAVPNFIKARQTSWKNACVANLKQIDGAKLTWAMENKKAGTDVPVAGDLYGPAAYIPSEPLCPGGGGYTIGRVDTSPVCSLSAAEGHAL